MSTQKSAKRVLVFSPFFYPELISTGKYNAYLVKELVETGCTVDVIASHPLYPDWKPSRSDLVLNGVNIHRGGANVHYPKSAVFRRLVLEIWFTVHALINTIRLRNKIDLILFVFPPVLFSLIVNLIVPRHVVKIGVVHDIQGVMAESSKSRLRYYVGKLSGLLEKVSYSRCDRLICLSNSMREYITNIYKIPITKCVVHYPFVTNHAVSQDNSSLEKLFDRNFKHIVYSGALGEKQKPMELLKLFESLVQADDEIVCHIFSRGPLVEVIKSRYSGQTGSRIRFHDLVDEKDLFSLYELSDVQVIPQAEDTSAGAFPSKLPNLISQGVPLYVICDSNSELVEVLGDFNYCRLMHEWDNEKLVKGLLNFLDEIEKISHEDIKSQLEQNLMDKFSVNKLVDTIISTSK